ASVAPKTRYGAVMASGKTCLEVVLIRRNPKLSMFEMGDASSAVFMLGVTVTRGSAITLRARSVTDAMVSPGSNRKFTSVRADPGSTLALMPPARAVAAVVVRTDAAVGALPFMMPNTTGLSSHRFEKATLLI